MMALGGSATVLRGEVAIDSVAILVFFFGLGLWMIYRGFDEYRMGRLIRDTGTETVQGAAVGRTELQGVATPTGQPLARPFTDGTCIYANYQIIEEREDSDGDTTWATLDHDTWVVDFQLEDGTGSVLVEPEITARYEISDGLVTTIEVPEDRSEPAGVAEFLEHGTEVDPTTTHRRRYIQEVIPPGTTVYVLGAAEIRPDAPGREEDSLVIRRDDASDRFVISDMDESALTGLLSRRAPILVLFGLVMSIVSLYLLLNALGVGLAT